MSTHTDVVPYRWTNFDRLAASPWAPIPNLHLTPYRIPVSAVSWARDFAPGDRVDVSLGLTNDPSAVARFFREGYEWIDVPAEVSVGSNIMGLFEALYAHDRRKFAHLDPALNVVATAASTIANAPGTTIATAIDPNLLPFADLALLHFEHWGNTDLRAAVINDLSTSFTIPLLDIDPLSTLMTSLVPLAIPTQLRGAKVEKVLARRPVKGVPIRAVPTTQPEPRQKQVRVMTLQPPRIELDRFDRQTLRPLRFTEWQPRASKIRFRIILPVSAYQTRIEILRGTSVYYAETHELGDFVLPGTHLWTWDGYDQDDVLDTTILKQNDLSARLTVVDIHGRTSVATTELGTAPGTVRWVDAKVMPRHRRIEVTVACRFTSPSDLEIAAFRIPLGPLGGALSSMIGGLASIAAPTGVPGASAVGMIPGLPSLPSGGSLLPPYPGLPGPSMIPPVLNTNQLAMAVNFPPILDLDEERFSRLQTAVMAGIARHWSRTVSLEGVEWTIDVRCQLRNGADAQWTVLCRSVPEALNDPSIGFGKRSFNLATFMEGLPIVNIWEDGDDDTSEEVTDIDAARARVGAHELGHSVLRELKSFYYSLTHKGTSTIGQDPSASAPSWASYADGEIDLMHYQSGGSRPADWQTRERAVEEDALALVGMATVSFG